VQTIKETEGTEEYNAAEMFFEEYREDMDTDMGTETKIDTVD
jgi:hypothetical protein